MAENGGAMFKRAGLFMLGVDIAYNIGSFSLSAPQTTERRINDSEGKSETPQESMFWVWVSTVKMLVYNGFASMLAGSLWPLFGGAVVIADLHASYRCAIYRGMRKKVGGKLGGGGSAAGAFNPAAGDIGAVYRGPMRDKSSGDDDSDFSPPFVTSRIGPIRGR